MLLALVPPSVLPQGCPHRCCCHQQKPPPLLTVDCKAVAMAVVDGSNCSHPWRKQWSRVVAAVASLLPPSTTMTRWWQKHQLPLHSWQQQPPLPPPPLAKDAIAVDATASSSLHPTAASFDDNAIAKDHHCHGCHWLTLPSTMTSLPPLTTNNDRWLLAVVVIDCVAAAMAVIDGRNSSCCWWQWRWDWANSTNGGVLGGGNDWWRRQQWRLYHCLSRQWPPSLLSSPLPLPSLGQVSNAGWRSRCNTSHLLLPWLLLLAPSLSPLMGWWCQGWQPRQQTWLSCWYPRPERGRKPQPHRHGATKKKKQQQWGQRHRLCACRQLHQCCRHCTVSVRWEYLTLRVSYSQHCLCNHNPLQKS